MGRAVRTFIGDMGTGLNTANRRRRGELRLPRVGACKACHIFHNAWDDMGDRNIFPQN